MKKKHFYSHLVPLDTISVEFNSLKLSEDEKTHLLTIVSSNIHYKVLDTVFSHLSTKDKETFLEHIEKDDHEKTWKFLKSKIENVEEKITSSSKELLKEFLGDIAKLKGKDHG